MLCGSLFSQTKTISAIKISQAPKIDGNLSDPAWAQAPVLTDFIQNFPDYGKPCSKPSEVKVLYDNSAIYVSAHLFDDPKLIGRQITARDGEAQTDVDYFSVFFDTYEDHQNGFQFLVTTANVQSDARLGPNLGGQFSSGDKTWDAVWESQVTMNADGWSVEMRIPYISLRFSKKQVQDWGIQFLRFIRRTNENSYWNPVDPTVGGFVNQFGQLKGLENIEPPLRLSFSPYVTTGYRSTPVKNNEYQNEWLRNGGMDVKYGISEGFTLDATLIPDFGQVVSDNVVNNLTPYEVRFQENRQFFTEGTELFNKAGLFYSRRVGATPTGFYASRAMADADPNLEIVKNPGVTQLLNAVKFSGRTRKKLGVGIFNAVTSPMYSILRDKTTGVETKTETEPLANYNILVLDQAFKDRSYITFTNTNVMRNGAARDANVSAFDVALYDRSNNYALNGTVRYSKIWGNDPYDGYNVTMRYGKVSGNWQYSFTGNVESENYDPNDLGILFAANEISYRGAVSYRQFKPTRNFITYSYGINSKLTYLYKPYAFNKVDINPTLFLVFNNFWDITLNAYLTPGWTRDYFELRTPNRYLKLPTNSILEASGSSDSRKKLFISFNGSYAWAPKYDNSYTSMGLGFRYRFSNKFTLSLQGDSRNEKNQLGYAFERELNGDPLVAFRDNKEFVSVLSGIYNFNSRTNLTIRARHYWNRVTYNSIHGVQLDGMLRPHAFISGKDENINLFNLDAFFTWDFRLGSKIVIGYKNALGDLESVNLTGKNTYIRNLGEVFSLRHGNEVTIRFIYFLDYNQLRKKH